MFFYPTALAEPRNPQLGKQRFLKSAETKVLFKNYHSFVLS